MTGIDRVTQDTSDARGRLASAMTAIETGFANLEGWPRAITALALGAISALAVSPFHYAPVLFVTLPLLILLLAEPVHVESTLVSAAVDLPEQLPGRAALRRAASGGWWFGFGYFFLGLHWIIEPFLVEPEIYGWLIPFAITLLPGGLALFFALAAIGLKYLWSSRWFVVFALAATIGATEWLRGIVFTGFPWNVLGHSLTGHDVPLQMASLIGVNGLTVLAPLVFATPLLVARDAIAGRQGTRATVTVVALYILAIAGMVGFGTTRNATTVAERTDVRFRLVQPAIPQDEKWIPENRRKVFDALLDVSRRNPEGKIDNLADITHVVWPESAIPFLLLRDQTARREIRALLPAGTNLITGALRINAAGNSPTGEREVFNALMLLDTDGKLVAHYDKRHLVPFGEYLPFQSVLESIGLRQLTRLRGGFTVGREAQLISTSGTPAFAPLVCYEGIFSGAVVTTETRPEWLLIVTNDAWFGSGAGPRQHFHQARIRAVEEGLPVIRVSNNGISAIIDPLGRTTIRRDLDTRGSLDGNLHAALPPTAFATWRHLPFWALLALCTALAAVCRWVTRRNFNNTQP